MTTLPARLTVPRAVQSDRPASLRAMLEARSVALVGASARQGSFGHRMLAEVRKSWSRPRIFPVNPRYAKLDGELCYPTIAHLPEVPDLVLLAVPDGVLEEQLTLAAAAGCRAAVIFGSAHSDGLRCRLTGIARAAGMALCGAGCMGFVNVSHGLRALGYTEPDPLPAGSVALVTHSGSVFSALLRARRGFGFTLAVSSGQELVTAAPSFLDYALDLPDTGVLALVLETIRDGDGLQRVLGRAAEQDVPVVLLAIGRSAGGRAMVAAHSGALAGSDGSWEALARAYGVHRVGDLGELADTVELLAAGRRAGAATGARTGVATVHDSGLERAHVVDVAESVGIPFAQIGPATVARLASLLDPGLTPENPLDVWGTGADTRELFGGALLALAEDPAVAAAVLAVDLVPELDGDESYPLAVLDAADRTGKPLAVLSNLGSAIDAGWASQLRARGIPVLEGTRSGLLALRHLLDRPALMAAVSARAACAAAVGMQPAVSGRQARAIALLASGELDGAGLPGGGEWAGGALLASAELNGAALLRLLAEYGFEVPRTELVASLDGALAAAVDIGYPVVLKTAAPGTAHKSDVRGVRTGIADARQLAVAYADLAGRLGSSALVCQQAPPGVELALGIATEPQLGPLLVIGAGGVLVELLADRVVALPPVSEQLAADLLSTLRVQSLLAGARGAPPADLGAVCRAIRSLSDLAMELGDQLEALDLNPLICGPSGAVAVDALVIPRQPG